MFNYSFCEFVSIRFSYLGNLISEKKLKRENPVHALTEVIKETAIAFETSSYWTVAKHQGRGLYASSLSSPNTFNDQFWHLRVE